MSKKNRMELLDMTTYTKANFNVEFNGQEYHIEMSENDVDETWEIYSADEGHIDIDSDLGSDLINFCTIQM